MVHSKQTWDAIVIGAGPAGMAAAVALDTAGCRTLLVDEQPAPGGQIYRNIEKNRQAGTLYQTLGPDYAHGHTLVDALRRSGVQYMPNAQVWELTPDRAVNILQQGEHYHCQALSIVIATGAMERPCPLPGWTLPGVMTAGALQTLIKSSGLVPECPFVLAGSGPLLYLIAAQCLALGARPHAIVDTTPRQNYIQAVRKLPSGLIPGHGLQYLLKGTKLLRAIHKAKIPTYRHAHSLRLEANGTDKVQRLEFVSGSRTHRLDCSLVGLHEGVIPQPQLSRSVRIPHRWNAVQNAFQPVVDEWGETALDSVFVVGDGAGIVGARGAEELGRLAALKIAVKLKKLSEQEALQQSRPRRSVLRRHITIRPFLDTLYQPRAELWAPEDQTTVCRCEEVLASDVRLSVQNGATGPNQIKSFLRTGMGPCQGCMCGLTVAGIVSRASDQTHDQVGYYQIRPPVKPVTLGQVLDAHRETSKS